MLSNPDSAHTLDEYPVFALEADMESQHLCVDPMDELMQCLRSMSIEPSYSAPIADVIGYRTPECSVEVSGSMMQCFNIPTLRCSAILDADASRRFLKELLDSGKLPRAFDDLGPFPSESFMDFTLWYGFDSFFLLIQVTTGSKILAAARRV